MSNNDYENPYLPHEMISKTLGKLPQKKRVYISKQLSQKFQREVIPEILDELLSLPFTSEEIDNYKDTGISHIGIFKENKSGTLYFCLLDRRPVESVKFNVYKHEEQYGDILWHFFTERIYNYCATYFGGSSYKLSEILKKESFTEYDLIITYNILKSRVQKYYTHITDNDIKKYLIKILHDKYTSQNDLNLIFLRSYLLFHCIIMGIKYGNVNNFLKHQPGSDDANSSKLEDKDFQIIDGLYNLVVDGIHKLD